MKKILSVMVSILLIVAVFTCSANAYTLPSEWTRMTGPAEFSTSSAGATVAGNEGVTFMKYTKEPVDVTDFTCTFSLEQDAYYDFFGGTTYYYAMTLTNKLTHSGSQGLFLLLMPTSTGSLRIEGQILNTGWLLSPSFVEFNVDTTKPITLHGKVIGESTYQITLDGSNESYLFEIPVNYQFHTDLDGVGYFGFGTSSNGTNLKMTVSGVNELDFTGEAPTMAPTTTTTNSNADPTVPNNDNTDGNNNSNPSGNGATLGNNNQNQNQNQNQGSSGNDTLVIVLIVCVAVLALIVIGGAVLVVLLLKKQKTAPAENPVDKE